MRQSLRTFKGQLLGLLEEVAKRDDWQFWEVST
jgi:hypothetical protein